MQITKAVLQLREKLIEAANASGLPPVVVGLVLASLQAEVQQLTKEALERELGNERAEQTADTAE